MIKLNERLSVWQNKNIFSLFFSFFSLFFLMKGQNKRPQGQAIDNTMVKPAGVVKNHDKNHYLKQGNVSPCSTPP